MYIKKIILECIPFNENKEYTFDDYAKLELEKIHMKNLSLNYYLNGYIIIRIEDDKPICLKDYSSSFKQLFKAFNFNTFECEYYWTKLYPSNNLCEIKHYLNINQITKIHKKYQINENIINNETEILIQTTFTRGILNKKSAYQLLILFGHKHKPNGMYVQFKDIEKIDKLLNENIIKKLKEQNK